MGQQEQKITKEQILSKHTGKEGIYLTKGEVRGEDALDAMEEYASSLTEPLEKEIGELCSKVAMLSDDNKAKNEIVNTLCKDISEKDKEIAKLEIEQSTMTDVSDLIKCNEIIEEKDKLIENLNRTIKSLEDLMEK